MRALLASTAVFSVAIATVGLRASAQPLASAPAACAPLSIAPARGRLATGDRLTLRPNGGGGEVTFSLSGDSGGAAIEPGGELHAGDRAARFDVTATDRACGVAATAPFEVVASLEVEPSTARLRPLQTFHFVVRGGAGSARARLLDDGRGAVLGEDGVFTAPPNEGRWHAVFADTGSSREVVVTIEVLAKLPPFHARSAIVAVPRGGSAPLTWVGGSGSFDVVTAPSGAARIVRDASGEISIALEMAALQPIEVRAVDRVTHEESSIHVVVAPPLGDPSPARGTRTLLGDVAVGDVNGDGRQDLLVGHAERARAGSDTGGLLVFYGRNDGFGARPDLVIDGDRAGDHFGATLLVRDMTGDGVDDVLVAAPQADLGGTDRGAVYLFVGTPAGLTASPARVLTGEGGHDRFGASIAVGDLDRDGSVDLVVGAPGAKAHRSTCEGGRAYVFRGESNARGVFEAVPWQTLDLRDPLSDDAEAAVPCSTTPLEAGAAIALLDMDADGALDLVVGEPRAAFRQGTQWQGAVDIHRGARDGMLAATPSWAIHPDRSLAPEDGGFGGALDVVRADGKELLVVRGRAPQSRGLWAFVPGSLGPLAAPDAKGARVRVLTTRVARTSYAGRVRGDASIGDLDGDGRTDYLVTDPLDSPAMLRVFHADALADSRPLVPFADVEVSNAKDATGARLAVWSVPSKGAGLALLAPERTTAEGPFVGAVDVVTPSDPASVVARLAKRVALAIPNVGTGDRTGATVAFAPFGASLDALVGVPGASAGASANVGRIDRFGTDGARRTPIVGERDGARLGAAPATSLDFDGDGKPELAIADARPFPSALAANEVDPAGCLSRPDVRVGSGVVRIYARIDDRFVERARVVARDRKGLPNGFGAAFARGDVNGDRKDDLIVGRADGGPIEVILGRAFVPDKIAIVCRSDEGASSSLVYPGSPGAFEAAQWWSSLGAHVASVGDLDRDGCEDTAFSIIREGSPAGVIVAFGYDASHARCRGHATPLAIHLISHDMAWPRDPGGPFGPYAFDDLVARRAGVAIAGGADLTGDGVADLVFGDATLADATGSGPAVEIVSGAFLASICPNHSCPKVSRTGVHVTGGSVAVALTSLPPGEHVVLRGNLTDRGFGESLAVADLDGDHHADLAVGAPRGGDVAAFAGAAYVFRGPFAPSLEARREPWVTAVGDRGERSSFGASIAVARTGEGAFLLVGAPRSARGSSGTDVGAAYVFRLDAKGE